MSYTRVLKAKLSPENGCYADDGTVLTVLPRKRVLQKQYVSHHFISVDDLKTKSRYGWVEEVPELTIEEFLERYHGGSSEPALVEHVKRMLESAGRAPVGASMAANYAERIFPSRRMEFTVHRVIFYELA